MRRTSAVSLLLLAGVTLVSCGPGPRADAARVPLAVALAEATTVELPERLEAGGVVAARESALLSSRLTAPVREVRVRAGDTVRKGAVLVTLDARDVAEQANAAAAAALAAEKALTRAQADRSAAQAEHRLAHAWHARILELRARDSATEQERDEADARLAAASARLEGTDAGVDLAAANLASARAAAAAAATAESFTVLRAPFDGLVTERLTDPGNLAGPGTPLLRLESLGARQVLARVDEARAEYVHAGDRVDVLIDAGTLAGEVVEVARAVDADLRAFTVKIALPEGALPRSGTFARVLLPGPSRRAVVVPEGAVVRQGQVTSVFVVQDGVARLRLVCRGAGSPGLVEVLAGLEPGETVVSAPPPQLADGSPVTAGAAAAAEARP